MLLSLLICVSGFAQEYITHTVTKGQGLYSISRMYGITEADIIKLNPGSEKVIKVGQELRIPTRPKQGSNHFHTIQQGETLYKLSVENRVSVKEICDANPGLSAQNFKVGQVITIPFASDEEPLDFDNVEQIVEAIPESTLRDIATVTQDTARFKATHTVARRETIFKISRTYGISQAEFLEANPEYRYKKLTKGSVVNIPFSQSELEQRSRRVSEAQERIEAMEDSVVFRINEMATSLSDDDEGLADKNIITAALLLPFALDDTASVDRKKMVEFYQGMLLALDRLKKENVSVHLKVFDTGGEESSITPLLESGKLDSVDVIFGPKWPAHIAEAASWSTEHSVPLVLPMSSNADEVFNHPYIFQLNTPQSYFHQEIYNHFLTTFPNPNIILLDAGEYKKNDFIDGFKATLAEHDISYTTLMVDTAYQIIMDTLSTDRQNIFIINSPASGPLGTMLPVLQIINRTKSPDIETHLFGYPEYQIYASDHLDELYEVDTWFYSWFYTNNMLQESINFNAEFRKAFSRQMMISYPSFASYGYDTGYYFIKGLSMYGRDLVDNLDKIPANPVQMGFKFERVNNWGGFINRKVFFVHFSNDCKVEKIDFDK